MAANTLLGVGYTLNPVGGFFISTVDIENDFLFLSVNHVNVGSFEDFLRMPSKRRVSLLKKLNKAIDEMEAKNKELQDKLKK